MLTRRKVTACSCRCQSHLSKWKHLPECKNYLFSSVWFVQFYLIIKREILLYSCHWRDQACCGESVCMFLLSPEKKQLSHCTNISSLLETNHWLEILRFPHRDKEVELSSVVSRSEMRNTFEFHSVRGIQRHQNAGTHFCSRLGGWIMYQWRIMYQ